MDRPRPPGRTNCAVVFIQAGPSSRTWDSCGCGGLRAAAAQRAHDHGNVRACLRVSEREHLGRWRARAHPPAPRTGVYVVGRLPNAMPAIQRRRIGRALSRRRRALAYRSVALHRSLWAANGIVLDARRRRCPHPAQPRRRRAVGPWKHHPQNVAAKMVHQRKPRGTRPRAQPLFRTAPGSAAWSRRRLVGDRRAAGRAAHGAPALAARFSAAARAPVAAAGRPGAFAPEWASRVLLVVGRWRPEVAAAVIRHVSLREVPRLPSTSRR